LGEWFRNFSMGIGEPQLDMLDIEEDTELETPGGETVSQNESPLQSTPN